ncbi:MAG: hypothetical protein LBG59_06365 [Candidatus Peribacteria bacterium]|nr:hypothetical protein [Candidatus Peribacteria bacterium]
MKNHNEPSEPQQNLVGQGDSVETKEITDKPQEQSKTQEKLNEELVQNYLNHFGQTEEHLPPSTLIEKAKFWEKKQEIL